MAHVTTHPLVGIRDLLDTPVTQAHERLTQLAKADLRHQPRLNLLEACMTFMSTQGLLSWVPPDPSGIDLGVPMPGVVSPEVWQLLQQMAREEPPADLDLLDPTADLKHQVGELRADADRRRKATWQALSLIAGLERHLCEQAVDNAQRQVDLIRNRMAAVRGLVEGKSPRASRRDGQRS